MARRFLSEIRLARKVTPPQRLPHPRVRRGRRASATSSMELVDGVNLKDVLQRAARSRADEAYDVVDPGRAGPEAVHEPGIIHRDFKTANIMIDDARAWRSSMDFGIAKEVGSELTEPSAAGHDHGHARST